MRATETSGLALVGHFAALLGPDATSKPLGLGGSSEPWCWLHSDSCWPPKTGPRSRRRDPSRLTRSGPESTPPCLPLPGSITTTITQPTTDDSWAAGELQQHA